MSAQKVSCPKCASLLVLPAHAAGNSVMRCSKCSAPFRVPGAAPKPTAQPPANGTNVSCPQCQKPLRISGSLGSAANIKCPHCAATFSNPTRKLPAPVQRTAGISLIPEKTPTPSRKATAGARRILQSQTAQKLKESAKQQWRNPKRRALIVGIGIGGAMMLMMAAGVMVLVLFAVSGSFFSDGNSSDQLAKREAEKPANQQQEAGANKSGQPVIQAERAKQGVIQLVKAGADPQPALLDPKNRPFLVTDAGGHSAKVSRVMFTPDGKQIISVSDDRTIRIWDVATAETVRVLRVPMGPEREGSLFAGALSKDGKTLAVAGLSIGHDDGINKIYVISLQSGQIKSTLTGHKAVIPFLEFSADGKRLASASNDTTARIWDVASGRTLHVLRGHTKLVRHIRISPDGGLAATVARDGTIRIWSMETGQAQAVCRSAVGAFQCVTWNLNGQIVAGGTNDGQIYLFDRNGTQQRSFKLHPHERLDLNYITWTKDPEELLYCGLGYGTGVDRGRFRGRAGIFNTATGQSRVGTGKHDNYVQHGDVSPDGRLAVTTGGFNNPTFVWRTSDAQIVARLIGKSREVHNVGWTADGKRIAWTNAGGDYFPKKGQFPPLRESFALATFTRRKIQPGERTVSEVLARDQWSLQFVNPHHLKTRRFGQDLGNFRTPGERMISFTLLPKNRAAIGMSGTANILVLDLNSGKTTATMRGHTGMIMGLAPSPNGRYLASCSTDSTICIWSLDTYKLVLRLFIAERDWIAWTPEGYYACSAFGERMMGWHINNGADKMASFHPAVRFRASLYKPEVIKVLLKKGNLKEALLEAGEKQNAGEPVKLADVLPPQVEITSPAPGRLLQTDKDTLEVTALAQSVGEHPVTAMRLLLDGRPYQGDGGHLQLPNPKPGQVQGKWTVKLPAGQHVISVQAESKVSKAVSSTLEVSRAGAGKELSNLYVLSIGISGYPGRMALRYAAADAIAIEKVFKEKTNGIFARVETKLVTDSAATRQGVYDGLDWLKQKMTAKDVGIIFFAGHGAQDRAGKFYLVPVDVRPGSIETSCISGDFVKRSLANIPGRLIAMFDACHSGAAAESSSGVGAVADNLARDLVTEEYGIVVMCSSLGSEYSMESSEVQHGFFTVGLVKGLEGKADQDNDQKVFLHEVDRYAFSVVRELSGGRQNPVTSRPPSIPSCLLSRP